MGIQGSNAFTGHVFEGRSGFKADGFFLLEAFDRYPDLVSLRTDTCEGVMILFPEDVSSIVECNYGGINSFVEGSTETITVESAVTRNVSPSLWP